MLPPPRKVEKMDASDEISILCKGFKISKREVRGVFKTLRSRLPWAFPQGVLSLVFVDDDRCCELHEKFLNDPSKTDVITFPGDEVFELPVRLDAGRGTSKINPDFFAGEIVVCVDQALRAAKKFKTAPADEILLYLVHGYLHLAGLDDLCSRDRRQMREGEREALALLRSRKAAPFKKISFPQTDFKSGNAE